MNADSPEQRKVLLDDIMLQFQLGNETLGTLFADSGSKSPDSTRRPSQACAKCRPGRCTR